MAVAVSRAVQLGILVVIVTSASFARLALAPLQEAVRRSLSFTDAQVGMLQGPILTLPMVIAAIPIGMLIDRHSRARLLLLCAAAAALGGCVTAVASNYDVMAIARAMTGLATFAVNPIAYAYISDLYAADVRGRASTAMAVGQTVGISAVFAAGGLALVMAERSGASWRSAMLWLCLPSLISIAAALCLREPGRVREQRAASIAIREGFRVLWNARRALLPLVVAITAFEIILSTTIWIGPALMRRFGLGAAEAGGIVATALLFSGFVGPLFGGFVADYCHKAGGPRGVTGILCLLAMASSPAGFFAFLPSSELAAVAIILLMASASAACLMTTALFTILVPAVARGLFFGAFVGLTLIFAGFTPVLVTLVADALGGELAIAYAVGLVCVGASLLGFGAYAGAWRRLTRAR